MLQVETQSQSRHGDDLEASATTSSSHRQQHPLRRKSSDQSVDSTMSTFSTRGIAFVFIVTVMAFWMQTNVLKSYSAPSLHQEESSHHQSASVDLDLDDHVDADVDVDVELGETHSAFSSTKEEKKIAVAYTVTLTSCLPPDERYQLIDNAAVLKHSIQLASSSSSRYEYDLIAFVHTNATECVPDLERIGYQILVRDTPIHNITAEVRNQAYAVRLVQSGCCGARELLKLYAYTLEQYAVVVQVDLDVLFLKPLDDLFDVFLNSATIATSSSHSVHTNTADAIQERHAMHPQRQQIGNNIQLMFTRQYGLHQPNQPRIDYYYLQGGFMMVRPNMTAYNELLDLVKQGNFKRGWVDNRTAIASEMNGGNREGDSNGGVVKYPARFGGETIQGLLPFYYGQYHPDQALELNWCWHNTIVAGNTNGEGVCLANVLQKDNSSSNNNNSTNINDQDNESSECIPNCRATDFEQIYSAHLTDDCIKISKCPLDTDLALAYGATAGPSRLRLCRALHSAWHRIRHDWEASHLVPLDDEEDQKDQQQHQQQAGNATALFDDPTYGHCKFPEQQYRPIDWSRLPQNNA